MSMTQDGERDDDGFAGMTLRDYFAAAALPAIYAEGCLNVPWAGLAADAYSMADAMIAARKEKP